MAPIPSGKGKHTESPLARVVGSGTAGILELIGFHPVDTVAKRLMNNPNPIFVSGQPMSQGFSNMSAVIFKGAKPTDSALRKYFSLFPGLGFAAGYKVLQRVYKFGGQPFVTDYLATHHRDSFVRAFGEKNGKAIMHATAGSMIGIGEIVLLPLDVLKIKRQTNPEQFKGRGLFKIIADEGFGLYRGAGWTAARNAPGSFALFGGAAFVKDRMFGLKDYSSATFFQNFCASIGGAIASITISQPLDVIKTRIQARSFDNPESGVNILKNMLRVEGTRSLFKGLTPKLLVVGPKLIFSFTVAQQLIPILHKFFEQNGITKSKTLEA
ncbi:mitochondrial carrier [Ramicandelaber brevisporus]|nr:mitochondrial carrier [Ramicandelaber brevisporus]